VLEKVWEWTPHLLGRHPFPGPGLAIRILGEITREKVRMLQEVDAIFIQGLKNGIYTIKFGKLVQCFYPSIVLE